MSETYHVVARNEITGPIPPIARAVAKATGKTAFDVTREIRDSAGVLASGLSKDEADRLVGSLSQVSVRAFALAESDMVRFPEPVYLETARLRPDALEVSDLRDKDNRRVGHVNVPYRDIVFLATAHVRTDSQRRVVEPGAGGYIPPSEHPFGIAGTFGDLARRRTRYPSADDLRPQVRTETRSEYDHLLDIFAVEPAHHLRLNASTFNFALTGLDMQPSSIANLTFFIKHFGAKCGQAHIDPSIRHILDGSPHTNLKCNSPEQYDAYLSWRIQLLYHPDK